MSYVDTYFVVSWAGGKNIFFDVRWESDACYNNTTSSGRLPCLIVVTSTNLIASNHHADHGVCVDLEIQKDPYS